MKTSHNHIFSIIVLMLLPFVTMEAQDEIDPNWFLTRLTNATPHLSKETHDSIQTVLMRKYIQDYRDFGKEYALDSLAYRTDLFINEERDKQLINMTLKESAPIRTRNIDEDILQVDKEIVRLRNEETLLREKIERLKKQRQQRERSDRFTYIIETEIDKTKGLADSITFAQINKQGLPDFLPIAFTHIKREDLSPSLSVEDVSYYQKKEPLFPKTNFEKKYEEAKMKERLHNSLIYSIAAYDPDLIEFYCLKEYDDKSSDIINANRSIYIKVVNKVEALTNSSATSKSRLCLLM